MNSKSDIHHRLGGLFNITVTPFHGSGELNTSALSQNIERVISLGFDGILIGGTYGEFPTMTTDERAELFRQSMKAAAGRVPVMLCSADSDSRVVRDLTKLASELGGLPMITPPFVSEITDEQIVSFFREMAPLSRTGIIIYNAPGIGVTLSPSLIERISEIGGVIGIKQGDLNPTAIDQIANRLGGKIRLFCASDLAFLGPVMAGFDGVSSTNSSAFPELILKTYRSLEAGDAKTARDLHQVWYPFRALARRFGQPQSVKAAMNARGFFGGSVRPPLSDLSQAERQDIEQAVAEIAKDRRADTAARAA